MQTVPVLLILRMNVLFSTHNTTDMHTISFFFFLRRRVLSDAHSTNLSLICARASSHTPTPLMMICLFYWVGRICGSFVTINKTKTTLSGVYFQMRLHSLASVFAQHNRNTGMKQSHSMMVPPPGLTGSLRASPQL